MSIGSKHGRKERVDTCALGLGLKHNSDFVKHGKKKEVHHWRQENPAIESPYIYGPFGLRAKEGE